MNINKKISKTHLILISILLISLAGRLVLSFRMPFYAPPDEIRRMHILESIYYNNHVPVFGVETNHFTVIKPLLGYRLSAYVARLMPFDADLYIKFRISSAIWGVVTIFFAYLIFKKIFSKSKFLQIGSLLAVAFWPQFIYINSYINIDSFTVMTCSIAIFLLLKIYLSKKINYKLAIVLGIALGLVFLSKKNGYIIFVLTAFLLLPLLIKKFSHYYKFFFVSFLSFIVFPILFYLRNYIIYGKSFILIQEAIPDDTTIQQLIYNLDGRDYDVIDISLREIFSKPDFFESFYKSSFAVFNHLNLFINDNFYYLFLFMILLSTFGLIKYFIKNIKKTDHQYFLMLSFFVSLIILFALVIAQNVNTILQPQGRYILPLLIPIVAIMQLGLSQITKHKEISNILVSLFVLFIIISGIYSFIILL